MGLFARRTIRENKVICTLGGEPCTSARSKRSAYVIQVAPDKYIDLAGQNSGYAAYINDPLDALLENCVIRWNDERRAYCVVANKTIEECGEILFNYGDF